jgi:N-acetylglutamate synthase-like GNAT family acetyltransferase
MKKSCKPKSYPFIRKAVQDDVDVMIDIQNRTYCPTLVESKEIFLDIISYDMSYVALDIETNQVIGYLLVHPSKKDVIPILHRDVEKGICSSDVLFIHDISILPKYQNKGIGESLFKYFRNIYNTSIVQLVSVNGSYYFWKIQGFKQITSLILSREHYESYGSNDIYVMELR